MNSDQVNEKIDTVIESVIDPPRDVLSPDVFEFDGDVYELRPDVRQMILTNIDKINDWVNIGQVIITGSILSYNYDEKSDLDVHAEALEEMDEDTISNIIQLSGEEFAGPHEINYFVYEGLDTDAYDVSYDVKKNEWIKGPIKYSPDINKYKNQIEKWFKDFDTGIGELYRDVVDYKELEKVPVGIINNIKDKTEWKLKEIENELQDLMGQFTELKAFRNLMRDPDPYKIQLYGSKGELPENVIYSLARKYHYTKFFKDLKSIVKGGVQDHEVDDILAAFKKRIEKALSNEEER